MLGIIKRLGVLTIYQAPFIIIFMMMMGCINTLQWIHGRMTTYEEGVSIIHLMGNISICFLMAFIVSLAIEISCKKWVKFLCYFITFIMFAFETFLMQNFRTHISSTIFALIIETNKQESEEFLHSFLFSSGSLKTYIILTSYLAATILMEYLWGNIKNRFNNNSISSAIVGFTILPLIILGLYSSIIYIKIWQGVYTGRQDLPNDPFSRTFSAILEKKNDNQHIEQLVKILGNLPSSSLKTELDDSLNLVLVIGESHIKHHSSIYGYRLSTSPFAQHEIERGYLIPWNDVVTPANNTTTVLKNLFCCNNTSNNEPWHDYPLFSAIFKKAGYNVLYWDNQLTLDVGTRGFFQVRNFLYNSQVLDYSFSTNNDKGFEYDHELIEDFSRHINLLKSHNLIIFHLKGQHIDAAQRFPHNATFNRFTIDSINKKESYLTQEKKQRIADYDNATFYNDWVLGKICNLFKSSNTILIYLSDHGDEVYDYRDQFGREFGQFTPQKLHCQFDVPFLFWFSNKYFSRHKEIIEKINSSKDLPYMTDKLCHLLFNIGSVETNYYKMNCDPLSENYSCGKRIVNSNHDYDQILNNSQK